MKKARNSAILRTLLCFLLTFSILGIGCWFVRFPRVSGDSMAPGYTDGQVIPSLHRKDAGHGDVVVVWSAQLNEYVVKRVIGLGGDRIEIRDGRLFRNGTPLYERYVAEQGWAEGHDPVDIVVPEGQMFLLGDNRAVSQDSRAFGCLPLDDIFGIVLI